MHQFVFGMTQRTRWWRIFSCSRPFLRPEATDNPELNPLWEKEKVFSERGTNTSQVNLYSD